METLKQKAAASYDVLKKDFGYKNKLAAPRIQKVVVSVGTGSGMKKDRTKNDFVIDRVTKFTGQKPAIKGAKQSVASFKTRAGDPIGVMVTLRGERMWNFLDKLVNIALPRTKDFRGITRSSAGELGNMSIGIREHTIFPETSDEEISQVFGLSVTIVTTAKTRPEGLAFFEYLGFPLKKEDEKKARRARRRK
jgi:large subunit ribosomal protein L5